MNSFVFKLVDISIVFLISDEETLCRALGSALKQQYGGNRKSSGQNAHLKTRGD